MDLRINIRKKVTYLNSTIMDEALLYIILRQDVFRLRKGFKDRIAAKKIVWLIECIFGLERRVFITCKLLQFGFNSRDYVRTFHPGNIFLPILVKKMVWNDLMVIEMQTSKCEHAKRKELIVRSPRVSLRIGSKLKSKATEFSSKLT